MFDRQTGRTSNQMKQAPQGAIFVWCVFESISYAMRLSTHLKRADLQIVGPDWGLSDGAKGSARVVVFDHAFWSRTTETHAYRAGQITKYQAERGLIE